MSDPRRIRRLVSSVLSLVAGLGACGGSTTTSTPMQTQGKCSSDSEDPARYQGLVLDSSSGIDGIEFRSVAAAASGAPAIQGIGKVCSRATVRDACLSKVAAARSDAGWAYSRGNLGANPEFGVATRGDDVFVLTSADQLAKAVAPITTAGEAATLVSVAYGYVKCSEPNVSANATGFAVRTEYASCGNVSETMFTVTREGGVTRGETRELETSSSPCAEGRRPSGLVADIRPWLSSLAEHFSEVAFMEAAAILAFDELHEDLAARRAPKTLLRAIRTARADEVRHARATARLARRFGGAVRRVVATPAIGPRSYFDIALENAREGCVRETYGAIVASYQAAHARDAEVARVFAEIAEEEIAHAELSWRLAAWLDTHLSPAERLAVERARTTMVDELRSAIDVEPSEEVRSLAGMPSASVAARLLEGMLGELAKAA